MDRLLEIGRSLTDVETTAHLLQQDFVLYVLVAIALLGLLAGAIGPFIVMRQMSFSVHGASELALTGAAAALLFGLNLGLGAIVGSVIAALMFGLMGTRARSEEHTSELQSRGHLVCRLLLEKKNIKQTENVWRK